MPNWSQQKFLRREHDYLYNGPHCTAKAWKVFRVCYVVMCLVQQEFEQQAGRLLKKRGFGERGAAAVAALHATVFIHSRSAFMSEWAEES